MPQESQIAHRVISNTALPYISNVSPSNTDPHYVSGSADILTSINGYAERRPGFATNVETTPTVFNNLQRLFTWDRFDGTFIKMACDINASGFAQVFKLVVGIDNSFVSIFTDTSNVPFDFVVSNNTLYFSNGNVAKKWDPVNGVSNWGIAIGSVNNATGPDNAGAGISTGSGVIWTNPNNVTSNVSLAQTVFSFSSPGTQVSQQLQGTTFGFSIPATSTINGIQVAFSLTQTVGGAGGGAFNPVSVQLLKGGNPTGTAKTINGVVNGTTTITLGGAGDLWGSTFTYSDINQSNFGFQVVGSATQITAGSATYTEQTNTWQVTVFGTGGPSVAVSSSAGSMTATAGYTYVFCYGNSASGHISSPTPVSPTTGTFTSKANVQVSLTASTDPQVNQIRPFRTTDGGGGTYFELPVSNFPNIGWTFTSVANAAAGSTVYTGTPTGGSGFASSVGQSFLVAGFTNSANNGTFPCTAATATTVTLTNASGVAETHAATGTLVALDSSTDANLQIGSIAPTPTFNDSPTPIQGIVYFSGRIWGFTGNKVWFSGLEEINQGVPEESFPSGIAGNFWTFDQPVQGLGIAGGVDNQVLAIFCGGRVYGISGNTLDTFRRFLVSSRRGARNRTCISMLGGMCAWLDSANQVWASDGSTVQELSIPIRPDLTGITQANCSMTFHTAGRFHWLMLSTGSKLFVYDVDNDQWMPPWNFSAQYLFSGEISPGNYVLMAATATKALQMSTSAFNDNGTTYAPVVRTSLFSVVPDFGSRFSYIAAGAYNEPTRTGVPWVIQVTNNAQTLTDVSFCQDDDPTKAIFKSITTNLQDTATTYNRQNGTFLTQQVYPTTSPSSRWIGLKITLENVDQADNLYEYVLGYKSLGGR